MASKVVAGYHATGSAATAAGSVTVTSTTGLQAEMRGFIAASGVASRAIRVLSVTDATHFVAAYDPKILDDNFARSGGTAVADAGYPTNMNGSDLSAYNASPRVDFEQQLVYDPAANA